TSFPPAT
ncbi:hypothetical protein AZE42_02253, partial [Rhizopogon vesiculosus]